MKEWIRVLTGVFILLVLMLAACMEPTELHVREVRVNGSTTDEGSGEDLETFVVGGEERTRLAQYLDQLYGADAEEERFEPGQFMDSYEVREQEGVEGGGASGGSLAVDASAPDLQILTVERHEGADGHFLSLECHDATPGLPTRWYQWRRQVSRECSIDLASAVQAITLEPAHRFRLAPTARGLRIMGDFAQGDLEMVIQPGLRTEGGAVLKSESRHTIHFPRLSPSLTFTAQGRYLPRSAWEDLTIRHRNVEEVKVEVRHIPAQNLAFYLSQPVQQWRQNEDETLARTANLVASTEMALRGEEDKHLITRLSLQDLVPRPTRGLYQISLQGGGAETQIQLQVTDINLVVKRHEASPDAPWEEAIDVWAVHMESTREISGVRVEAIRPSGFVMARCETRRNGYCRLELPKEDIDQTAPFAIIARHGEDMTYLRFRDVPTELVEGRIDGIPFREHVSYRATLHGDRDLYRPGDTLHLVGALRDEDYSNAGAQIPTHLVVRDPQNKIVVDRLQDTNAAGLVELSFSLNEIAPTGRWRAELSVGERRLTTYHFHVEEFVPERLEVEALAATIHVVGAEQAGFEVSARYLFGANATGSTVQATCQVRGLDSRMSRGFHFGPLRFGEGAPVIDLPEVQAVIDEDNQALIKCPPLNESLDTPARVIANVAVSESGSGRASRASATTTYFPEPIQVGLQSEVESIRSGDTLALRGIILDLEDQPAGDYEEPITLEFFNVRTHWSRQVNPSTGRHSWERNYQFSLERVLEVTPREGRFRVETTAAEVATAYLVRARYGNARTDLQIARRGHYWDWSAGADTTPHALRPGVVRFAEAPMARMNQPTEIQFEAPFAGRALLTVETDQVLFQEWREVEAGQNKWRFTLEEHFPNVYVSAFVIRDPRHAADRSFAPERAFGAFSVPMERSHLELTMKLDTPQEVRPGETFEVDLQVRPSGQNQAPQGPVFATIAAVDEGILQLTNYKSPDPLTALLARRALGVQTFDTVGWATQLPPVGPSSRTGGGDYYDESGETAGRIMPFQPVALFSGLVELDRHGKAKVSFDVPNYRGRLRVMAVAFSDHHIGSSETSLYVRDPLTVDATFPRFLISGDLVEIPVYLANLTAEDRVVEVKIEASNYDVPGIETSEQFRSESGLLFEETTTQTVEVAAGQSRTLRFRARSQFSGGAAKIRVLASSGELRSSDEGMIPFHPGGPRERLSNRIALEEGEVSLVNLLSGWERGSEETYIWASALPEPQSFDHLEYLIRYPHGCAEQTISSARPLLFVSQLVEAIVPGQVASSGGVDSMVESGISRILSMQASNGAVAYWPGGSWYSTWVTAYALHFLLDASELGYAVPQARKESAMEWLQSQIDSTPESAYGHYVLALAGKAQMPAIRRAIAALPGDRAGAHIEQAYLLYAALYLGGDRSYEEELRSPQAEFRSGRAENSRTFFSEQRSRGLMLSVFIDLFGTHADGEELFRQVAKDLRELRYRNTQTVLWGVTGLGKWLQNQAQEGISLALFVNGRSIAPSGYVYGLPRWSLARLSERGDVTLQVQKTNPSSRIYGVLTSEGVRQNPTNSTGSSGLRISQTLLDRRGNSLGDRELVPGELLYVSVNLSNPSGRQLRNLAMVSRLPAGLEVENQNLNAAELPSFARNTWETDYFHGRDDRMEFFGTLNRGQSVTMTFPVRATLSGEFHYPSAEVEAMYETEFWARSEPGTLRIGAPRSELVD